MRSVALTMVLIGCASKPAVRERAVTIGTTSRCEPESWRAAAAATTRSTLIAPALPQRHGEQAAAAWETRLAMPVVMIEVDGDDVFVGSVTRDVIVGRWVPHHALSETTGPAVPPPAPASRPRRRGGVPVDDEAEGELDPMIPAGACLYDAPGGNVVGLALRAVDAPLTRTATPGWAKLEVSTAWGDTTCFAYVPEEPKAPDGNFIWEDYWREP